MEKRYFWIKLKEDFFDSEQMDFVHEQPNGAEYIYIYLRLCLMSANNSGIVERRIGPMVMPYSIPKLAEAVKSNPDSVRVALNIFRQIGLVEETESGAISIPSVGSMVGSEGQSAGRVRKHRAQKAALELPEPLQCNESLLQSNKNVTVNVTTDNRDKILDIRDKKVSIQTDSPPKKRRFSVMKAIDGLMVGEELKTALKDWVVMRRDELKSPVSERALSLGLSKLKEVCGADEALMVKVVNQSVFHDWKGFFPLHVEKQPAQEGQARRDAVKAAVEKGGW